MFDTRIIEKEIIEKITVRKPLSQKELSFDLAGNLLTGASEDESILEKVNLILTKEYLYLHYIKNTSSGNLEEISDIKRLSLEDIKEFLVKHNEIKEVITIKTNEETYNFVRDNHNQDNYASEMSHLIKKQKRIN